MAQAMIIDGYLDWAEKVPGPADKVYPQPNKGLGIACHSVVGNLPNHTIPSRFFDPNDQASVMFILYKDGHVIQMYPVTASTWTSGSYGANTGFWAIEAEGGAAPNYGELLTGPAEESFIRIVTEWETHTGRKALINENILQHKQLVKIYGGGTTACASDRYSNAWARINEGERYGETVSQKDFEDLVLATFSGSEDRGPDGKTLPREERLPIALDRMRNRADGGFGSVADRAESAYVIAQQGGGGKVPPHTHPATIGENQ